MKNPHIAKALNITGRVARRTYRVAKVTLLISTAVLAIIGAYVVSQPALRDAAIDHAQGQGQTMAEAPKGS